MTLVKHKLEDFCFAEVYFICSGFMTLLKKDGKGYYDVLNHRKLEEFYEIPYTQPLSKYIKCDEVEITIETAERLAKPHLKEFIKDMYKASYVGLQSDADNIGKNCDGIIL